MNGEPVTPLSKDSVPYSSDPGKSNPCNVCQHRWTPQQQKDGNGHCYMWQEEPHPCNRPSFKLDEQAFMLDIFNQLMRNVTRGVQS